MLLLTWIQRVHDNFFNCVRKSHVPRVGALTNGKLHVSREEHVPSHITCLYAHNDCSSAVHVPSADELSSMALNVEHIQYILIVFPHQLRCVLRNAHFFLETRKGLRKWQRMKTTRSQRSRPTNEGLNNNCRMRRAHSVNFLGDCNMNPKGDWKLILERFVSNSVGTVQRQKAARNAGGRLARCGV